jgi:hypothetical protein
MRLDLGDQAGAEQDARTALTQWEQRRQGGIGAVYALVTLGRLQARPTGTRRRAGRRFGCWTTWVPAWPPSVYAASSGPGRGDR